MKVYIFSFMFVFGLFFVICKAGASDLGASLLNTVPGALIGILIMIIGAYGLWIEDLKQKGDEDNEQAAGAARGSAAKGQSARTGR